MTDPLCHPPSAIVRRSADADTVPQRRPMRWKSPSKFLGQEEPGLRDIMNDPMTQRLMDSDGVRMDQLQAVISHLQRTLTSAQVQA